MAKTINIDNVRKNLPDGRRKLSLTNQEREGLARRTQLEHAVSLFLDLEQDRTTAQIAAEMDLSLSALKRLTTDPEFQMIYDEARLSLGHHPRLQMMQSALPDLLPLAYRKLHSMLTGRVADTAAVAAIKLLFETVNLKDTPIMDDPQQMTNFMKQRGVSVDGNLVVNVNLPIPENYKAAFSRLMGGDIIDVEASVGKTDLLIEGVSEELSQTPVEITPDA